VGETASTETSGMSWGGRKVIGGDSGSDGCDGADNGVITGVDEAHVGVAVQFDDGEESSEADS